MTMHVELSNPCIVCDGTDHWGARWKVGKHRMIACQQDDPEGFKRFYPWAEPVFPRACGHVPIRNDCADCQEAAVIGKDALSAPDAGASRMSPAAEQRCHVIGCEAEADSGDGWRCYEHRWGQARASVPDVSPDPSRVVYFEFVDPAKAEAFMDAVSEWLSEDIPVRVDSKGHVTFGVRHREFEDASPASGPAHEFFAHLDAKLAAERASTDSAGASPPEFWREIERHFHDLSASVEVPEDYVFCTNDDCKWARWLVAQALSWDNPRTDAE